MKNFSIEEKDSFIVLGIGVELKSDYRDFLGLKAEKTAFWNAIETDGRLSALKDMAANGYLFAVNESVNNKMMHYAGVLSEGGSLENARLIQFPKGKYLVVQGEADSFEALEKQLTQIAFGQVLPSATEFAYVGGPNAMVQKEQQDDLFKGEMWIPVVMQ